MTVRILKGDCREVLRTLPDESVHCVVTSPPYFGLRDYGVAGQIGLEATPEQFVAELVEVFRDVRRVLRADGTLWLNLGDSYASTGNGGGGGAAASTLGASDGKPGRGVKQWDTSIRAKKYMPPGLKTKDLIGIPWRVAFALQSDGWYLRQDIIWSKPNPMPESVTDRCTKAHEYIFLLSKSARYHYEQDAIREEPSGRTDPISSFGSGKAINGKLRGGRDSAGGGAALDGLKGANRRSVWEVSTAPYADAHFATFPPGLIEPCILAGCPAGGTVLDPFGGAGTTGLVADRLKRNAILIELNPEYATMAERRIKNDAGMFASVAAE